ncbi:MAG: hypothetical protein WC879_01350 [Melioribacteraceae bacterium]
MKTLAIIMIILGLLIGRWTVANNQRSVSDRPGIFNTDMGGCMMGFIPFALIVGGIYILMTI